MAPQTQAKAKAEDGALIFKALILTGFAILISLAISVFTAVNASDEPGAEGPSEATGYAMYRRGLYEEALVEWEKAAEAGDAGAAFRLGEEYFDAKIVERDVPKALQYLMMGAEGGDPRAQMDLASMYDNGWGVPKSIDETARWYQAAAVQGDPVAQYNLATMYETGAGVEESKETAYMYYLLAIEGGFVQFATTALDNISREMTADEIKNATLMARQFEPTGNGAGENDG